MFTLLLLTVGLAGPTLGEPAKKGEAAVPKGWQMLVSKEGGFRVALIPPAAKQKPIKESEPVWFSGFDLDKGQSTTVGYYDMEGPPNMPAVMMNKEWQEMWLAQFAPMLAKDPQSKVSKLRKVSAGKFAGVEGTIGDADAPAAIRYVIVGKRIFVLTAEAKTEKDAQELGKVLFASFEVLPELARSVEVKAPAWERFHVPAGKFSVLMPGEPSLEESKADEELGGGAMKVYTAYHPDQALVLAAISVELPEEIRKKLSPDDILDRKVKKGRKITLGKYPGRELEETQQGKGRGITRTYVVEDRVLAVVVIDLYPTQGAMPRDTARFLDSLRLEKK
jgi:hypothetical protein